MIIASLFPPDLAASQGGGQAAGSAIKDIFVPRLCIYPHALREANAYYSPEKSDLNDLYYEFTVEA